MMQGIIRQLMDKLAMLYRLFQRPISTASIIIVLMSIYSIGLLVPQKATFLSSTEYAEWKSRHVLLVRVVEAFQLNEIYLAPITITFLGMFFLNLIIVIWNRIPSILRRAYVGDSAAIERDLRTVKLSPSVISIVLQGSAASVLLAGKTYFRRRFWTVYGADSNSFSFVAIKNRFSPFGFLLFHISFLLCLLGGILIMYTRFSGVLVLTEGQEFASDIKQFQRITRDPKLFKALAPLQLQIQRVIPHHEQDTVTDLDIAVKISWWGTESLEHIRINQPIKRGSISLISNDVGFAPSFVLRDSRGHVLDSACIALNIMHGDEDSFQLLGAPYTYFVRFFPDYQPIDGKPNSRSLSLNNPVMLLRVMKGDAVVAEAMAPIGKPILFEGLTLTMDDVRFWIQFTMVREYGTLILYIGFLFGAIGLIMRLIFYQKVVRVFVEEQGDASCVLWIDGRSEYYPYSFAEQLSLMVEQLSEHLRKQGVAQRTEGGTIEHH